MNMGKYGRSSQIVITRLLLCLHHSQVSGFSASKPFFQIAGRSEMDEMENTNNEETKSLKNSVLSNYDYVFHAHTSDIKKVNEKITSDCEKFLRDYDDSCSQMQALSKSLQQREYELEKKQRKLQNEKTKQEFKMRVRERLSFCRQLVNESYNSRELAEGLKDELDMLHKRRNELEAQLTAESFESLQTEIIQIETALQVIQEEDCVDIQEKFKNLQSELIEKDKQLQILKNQTYYFRSSTQTKDIELQDARLELIDGLKTYPVGGCVGVKKMGLIDSRPFFIGRCHSIEKRKENETKFASLCKHLVEDPNWHPFTAITVGSDIKEVIDEEDEKLVILKAECNEEQYDAVVKALIERNRYRQSGSDLMRELWNYKENREATLREGIDYILKEWKINRQRKRC